jgi:hypothetical protein
MTNWAQLLFGTAFFLLGTFVVVDPQRAFEFEKRYHWTNRDIDDTERLELSPMGAARRQLIAALFAFFGFLLIGFAVF